MFRINVKLMAAIAVLLLFTAPFSWAQRNQRQTTPAPAVPASPFFTGDGGRGMTLAVLVPEGRGLAANQNYLPTLVQGVIVGDLSKYSAISVLDRLRLETVLKETESGIYRNENDFGRLGEIARVDYALTGSITRTSTGYAMQIQIVGTGKNNIGVTKASYSGSCAIAEFDNFTGIKRASLELLTQMGVNLTNSARKELSSAGSSTDVQSQKALSQGIVAQRSGNEFQAMLNYFEARTFNPNTTEASARITSASTAITANNMQNTGLRERVLSEIERVKEAERQRIERERNFDAVLKKATAFYKAHHPFQVNLGRISYGNIDSRRGTVDISATVTMIPLEEEIAIIRELSKKARSILNVRTWPFSFGFINSNDVNERGVVGEDVINFRPGIWKISEIYTSEYHKPWGDIRRMDPSFTVVVSITNEQGKRLGTLSYDFNKSEKRYGYGYSLRDYNFYSFGNVPSFEGNYQDRFFIRWDANSLRFRSVSREEKMTIKADDLSDTMTVRIISVNGRSVSSIRSSGYLTIPQESRVIKL